jgi:nucleotide-binding universal stress UspA family protein
MATCFTSTLLADRYAPRLPRPRPVRALGSNIVVPVANPATAGPLTEIAAAIAAADSGTVTSINVLGRQIPREEFDEHRAVLLESEVAALRGGVEASSRIRIDDSTTEGIIHEVVEQGATAVLMGWKGYSSRREHFFGGMTDRLLEAIDVPVILCRPGSADRPRRVILVPPAPGQRDAVGKLQITTTIAERLATRLRTEVVPARTEAVSSGQTDLKSTSTSPLELLTTRSHTMETIAEAASSGDIILLHAVGNVSTQLESLARNHPDLTILVVVTR